jgi:hypothetical protein
LRAASGQSSDCSWIGEHLRRPAELRKRMHHFCRPEVEDALLSRDESAQRSLAIVADR